jgi:hypothetical protein
MVGADEISSRERHTNCGDARCSGRSITLKYTILVLFLVSLLGASCTEDRSEEDGLSASKTEIDSTNQHLLR